MIRDTWGPQISRDDWPTKYEPRVGCFMNFVETTRSREVKKVGEFSSRVLTRTLTTPSQMEVRYVSPTAGKELSYNVDLSSNALPTEGGGFQLPCGFPRASSAKLRPTLQAWVVGQKLAGHYTSFRHGSGALRAACPDSPQLHELPLGKFRSLAGFEAAQLWSEWLLLGMQWHRGLQHERGTPCLLQSSAECIAWLQSATTHQRIGIPADIGYGVDLMWIATVL